MIPMKRTEIFSDYERRLNFYIDNEAKKLDGFFVGMPATGMAGILVHDARKEWTFEQLWSEAMRTAAWLRAQPYERVYPETVFIPFVEVTAVDTARESAKHELRMSMLIGCAWDDQDWERRIRGPAQHEERVRALCKASDLLNVLYARATPQAPR